MNTREAIAARILQLCREHGITPNRLSNIPAVSQATIKSILNGEIILGEVFSTPEFDALEQEIC